MLSQMCFPLRHEAHKPACGKQDVSFVLFEALWDSIIRPIIVGVTLM